MNIVSKAELIREFVKHNPLVVSFVGSSMFPTIPDNSMITIHKVNNIKLGRIYIYLDKDPDSFEKLVCHRLIAIHNGKYILKGDNRQIEDPPINIQDILGEVKNEPV